MRCKKCSSELEPAGYPTFGKVCKNPKCVLLHNRDGSEMIPEPDTRRPTPEQVEYAREVVKGL